VATPRNSRALPPGQIQVEARQRGLAPHLPHLYFQLGDDSGFHAVRFGQESEIAHSARQVR